MDEKIIVECAEPHRISINVYMDFLYNNILSTEEKMMFIALKSFVNFKIDSNNRGFLKQKVYPTMETLCTITSMSKPRATKAIKTLMEKGIVAKTRRGFTQPNIYVLSDSHKLWMCETLEEMKEEVAQESDVKFLKDVSTDILEKELERRKGKSPEVEPTKEQQQDQEKINNSNYEKNDTLKAIKSQEKYSIEQVRVFFDYEVLVKENKAYKSNIDAVMDILYDVLNTTKETIKIKGEDKQASSVIAKLMKIGSDEIIYAIDKFNECTGRIHNPTSYMLSILYTSKEQFNLDLTNKVNYDMSNSN